MSLLAESLFVMAVDPGDEHVGWAVWDPDYAPIAGEHGAAEAVAKIESRLAAERQWRERVVLVLEEFRLYPDKAEAQAWSQLRTAEMVGALKYVGRTLGVEVVEQGANILKPIARQLGARKIVRMAEGRHARDAELHLYHYLLKEGLWQQNARP